MQESSHSTKQQPQQLDRRPLKRSRLEEASDGEEQQQTFCAKLPKMPKHDKKSPFWKGRVDETQTGKNHVDEKAEREQHAKLEQPDTTGSMNTSSEDTNPHPNHQQHATLEQPDDAGNMNTSSEDTSSRPNHQATSTTKSPPPLFAKVNTFTPPEPTKPAPLSANQPSPPPFNGLSASKHAQPRSSIPSKDAKQIPSIPSPSATNAKPPTSSADAGEDRIPPISTTSSPGVSAFFNACQLERERQHDEVPVTVKTKLSIDIDALPAGIQNAALRAPPRLQPPKQPGAVADPVKKGASSAAAAAESEQPEANEDRAFADADVVRFWEEVCVALPSFASVDEESVAKRERGDVDLGMLAEHGGRLDVLEKCVERTGKLQADIESERKRLGELATDQKTRIGSIDAELKGLRDDLKGVRQVAAAAAEQHGKRIDDVETMASTNMVRYEGIRQRLEDVESDVDKLDDVDEQIKALTENTIPDLKEEVIRISEETEGLRLATTGAARSLDRKVASMEKAWKEEATKVSATVGTVEQSIQCMQEAVDGMRQTVTSVEETNHTLSNNIKALDSRTKNLETTAAEAAPCGKKELDKIHKRICDTENERKAAKAELAKLASQMNNLTNNPKDTATAIKHANARLQKLEQQHLAHRLTHLEATEQSKSKETTTQFAQITNHLGALQHQLINQQAQLNGEIQAQEISSAETQTALDTHHHQLERLEGRHAETAAELDVLHTSLAQTSGKTAALHERIAAVKLLSDRGLVELNGRIAQQECCIDELAEQAARIEEKAKDDGRSLRQQLAQVARDNRALCEMIGEMRERQVSRDDLQDVERALEGLRGEVFTLKADAGRTAVTAGDTAERYDALNRLSEQTVDAICVIFSKLASLEERLDAQQASNDSKHTRDVRATQVDIAALWHDASASFSGLWRQTSQTGKVCVVAAGLWCLMLNTGVMKTAVLLCLIMCVDLELKKRGFDTDGTEFGRTVKGLLGLDGEGDAGGLEDTPAEVEVVSAVVGDEE